MADEAELASGSDEIRRSMGHLPPTDLLLRALPGAPLITVTSAAALIGRTFAPANDAIKRLEGAGILRLISVGRRNRAFEATGVIEAFTALERQLASPRGNTLTSEPSRAVPYRQAATGKDQAGSSPRDNA